MNEIADGVKAERGCCRNAPPGGELDGGDENESLTLMGRFDSIGILMGRCVLESNGGPCSPASRLFMPFLPMFFVSEARMEWQWLYPGRGVVRRPVEELTDVNRGRMITCRRSAVLSSLHQC